MATSGDTSSSDTGWEKRGRIFDQGKGRYAIMGIPTTATIAMLCRQMEKAKATEGISRASYDAFAEVRRKVLTTFIDVNTKLSLIEIDQDYKRIRMAKAHIADMLMILTIGDILYTPPLVSRDTQSGEGGSARGPVANKLVDLPSFSGARQADGSTGIKRFLHDVEIF